MDYKLNVKLKPDPNYSEVSLFPDTIINFGLDFYDVNNLDKIKVPVSVDLTLPMNDNNISVIKYDPTSTQYNTLPTEPFDFELYLNGSKVLEGNMYVESYSFNNAIPVIGVRLIDKLQEVFSSIKTVTLADMYSDYNSLMYFDAFRSLYGGSVGSSPTMGDIMFPYLDMCNDVEKFGYAARQFLQFGFDEERVGFIPAFNVAQFIKRFFDEAGVGTISRFFELGNYGTGITDSNPSDLYITLQTRLRAGSRARTRGFYVVEGPYEYYRNIYTKDVDSSQSNAREKDNYPYPSFGWNYSPTPAANPTRSDFGLTYTTNLPNTGEDVDKAYFGSNMGYNAEPVQNDIYTNSPRSLTNHFSFEIPMIQLGQNNFAMVSQINASQSSAVFNIVANLWEDGTPAAKFKMCNTDGSIKNLNLSSASIVGMKSGYLGYEVNSGGGTWINIWRGNQDPVVLYNNIEFASQTIGNFIWEQKEYEIKAGSTYSVSIEVELVSGTIDLDYVSQWGPDPQYSGDADIVTETNISVDDSMITKGIIREDTNNVGELYLALESVGTFNPYFNDDDVNVIWGLQDAEVSPYDVVKEIFKRFNLSAVYDQNTNSIIVDRLNDIRESNSTQSITENIDDAQEIQVQVVTDLAKSITIETSQKSLFYDTEGYGTKVLNSAGTEELKFSLASRVYNRSLCGDETFIEIPDGFSEYEVGFTLNEFTKYNKTGVVFGYIDTPQYQTNIRRGKFIAQGDTKTLIYDVPYGHTFPRFVRNKTNSLVLDYFDNQEQTTDLYDFFVGNDNILYFSKPTLSFKALLDSDYAFNIKDNYAKVTLSQIQANEIIIKSVKGEMYDQGIYADIEAIIL
jgi:hypothetical protein